MHLKKKKRVTKRNLVYEEHVKVKPAKGTERWKLLHCLSKVQCKMSLKPVTQISHSNQSLKPDRCTHHIPRMDDG